MTLISWVTTALYFGPMSMMTKVLWLIHIQLWSGFKRNQSLCKAKHFDLYYCTHICFVWLIKDWFNLFRVEVNPSLKRLNSQISHVCSLLRQMVSCLLFLKGHRLDIVCCVKLQEREEVKKDSLLFLFFKKLYAPFLLKDWVRPLIVSHSSHANSCTLMPFVW